jgi:hypothetical protein
LARIAEAVLEQAEPRDLLVEYGELPAALWERIAPHFHAPPASEYTAAMQAVASRDAKQPTRDFTPDSDAKRAQADEPIRRAAERWATAPYRELERRRLRQRPRV